MPISALRRADPQRRCRSHRPDASTPVRDRRSHTSRGASVRDISQAPPWCAARSRAGVASTPASDINGVTATVAQSCQGIGALQR